MFVPTVTVVLKKYFFQQKRTYLIKISSLTRGGGGEGVLLPGSLPSVAFSSHVWHILASSRLLRVLPIPAGPQAPYFPAQSTCSSFPSSVFGSICVVTWASRAAFNTWADVFPWDTLSENTCHGSLSHPTTDITWCCTYGCFSCELQREALLKNLYVRRRAF